MYIIGAIAFFLACIAIKLKIALKKANRLSSNLSDKLRKELLKNDPMWSERHMRAVGLIAALHKERVEIDRRLASSWVNPASQLIPDGYFTRVEELFFKKGEIDDSIVELTEEVRFLECDYQPHTAHHGHPYRPHIN